MRWLCPHEPYDLRHIKRENLKMSINYEIPENEVENVISVYWQMLGELESKLDTEKDILDKHLIKGAYDLLNRAGISSARPRFEKSYQSNALS